METTLKHLTYFRALCQYGHFAQAAESCAVSQPALSVKVQELEEILGAPLIDRTTRPYRPTPFGRDVLAQADVIMDDIDSLHRLARMRRGLEGPFTLGVIPTVAPYILPPALALIQRELPALDLQVREATTEVLLEELGHGQLDACIIATDTENDSMIEHALFQDRFLLAINAEEAAQLGLSDGSFQLTDMAQFRLLLLAEGHCLRDQIQSICRFTSTETLNQIGASSLQTLIGLSAGGYGVTLVPEIALADNQTPNLRYLRLATPEPDRTVRLVVKRHHTQMPDIGKLTEIFANVGTALTQGARNT